MSDSNQSVAISWYKTRLARVIWWFLGVSAVLIFVIIWLGIIAINYFGKEQLKNISSPGSFKVVSSTATSTDAKNPQRLLVEKANRPHVGNPQAKLVLVEFSDFQCPHCREEYSQINYTVSKYKDKILFIYRNYPVIDENSTVVAQASLCAGDQGKFWQMYDNLFSSPIDDASIDGLTQRVKNLGINTDQFNQCLTSAKYKNQVDEDTTDGASLGVEGTPTFFLNGYKVAGVLTVAQWDEVISKSLKALGQ